MLPRILSSVCMPRVRTTAFVLFWTGVGIHALTIYIAFRISGWLAAGLSTVFPIAAQVYWIVDLWQATGQFWHFLTLICASYALLWVILAAVRRR